MPSLLAVSDALGGTAAMQAKRGRGADRCERDRLERRRDELRVGVSIQATGINGLGS
jgi:hypothetical protein